MNGRIAAGTVERLAPTGEGVVRDAGRVVFVEGALAGEKVSFEITEAHRRWARGITREVLSASPDRVEMDSHSASCGGEDWAHVSLPAARRSKLELFAETMARLGGFDAARFLGAGISESPLGYRLRSQFHLAWRGGRAVAGFFRRRSHEVVPLEDCRLISEPGRQKLRAWLGERTADDVARWPTIFSAESVSTGGEHELAACGSRAGESLPGISPGIGIDLAGLRFEVSPASFFQVNRFRLEPFFRRVAAVVEAEDPDGVLEIGAGAAFLTAGAARSGFAVTAVEPSAEAAAAGRRNLDRNGLGSRVLFVESTADRFLDSSPGEADLVLADPPREGLGQAAARLARLARRSFLYISCEPATLARDLKAIVAQSFEIHDVFLEDFFPRTHRVEAGVLLRRR